MGKKESYMSDLLRFMTASGNGFNLKVFGGKLCRAENKCAD
jgi:hypothetical protein